MRGLGAAYGFLASILVGLGLGYGFDRWTHHGPFGMLAGILLGFVAGLYGLYSAITADAASSSPPRPEARNSGNSSPHDPPAGDSHD